ncbi:TetR family transcriptional regulator [Panacagrimonas perspica]|uniref:TetR family transcriptional regulator n=1 Tax=Panacagrimonas perspica TaxID=381431 RepID=A0A4S3K8A9_9GAMM|nr:TetR/AcrR family transcriptional regulator [Panacagrimonas perspica]TDU26637.1 TetR family transcriptional regulator [Panacagrimonas perspica]THD03994.1 hypothetical protein B1810_06955 [Panacagrimonas perspica]
MARTRAFDEQEALDGAMHLFWRRGYGAASLNDLLDATDLSKSSFYETFGNKRDLLLAALKRYDESPMAALIEPLRRPDPGRAQIEQTFRNVVQHALSEEGQRGCFVNNCLCEIGAQDPEIRKAAREVLDSLEGALANAVANGQKNGSVTSQEKPRATARFLVNTLSGINVAAKWKPGKAALDDIVRVALRALD